MNNEHLRLLAIALVTIFFGMLATVLLPLGYEALGIIFTVITLVVAITRR